MKRRLFISALFVILEITQSFAQIANDKTYPDLSIPVRFIDVQIQRKDLVYTLRSPEQNEQKTYQIKNLRNYPLIIENEQVRINPNDMVSQNYIDDLMFSPIYMIREFYQNRAYLDILNQYGKLCIITGLLSDKDVLFFFSSIQDSDNYSVYYFFFSQSDNFIKGSSSATEYDLELKKGWNIVEKRIQGSGKILYRTVSEMPENALLVGIKDPELYDFIESKPLPRLSLELDMNIFNLKYNPDKQDFDITPLDVDNEEEIILIDENGDAIGEIPMDGVGNFILNLGMPDEDRLTIVKERKQSNEEISESEQAKILLIDKLYLRKKENIIVPYKNIEVMDKKRLIVQQKSYQFVYATKRLTIRDTVENENGVLEYNVELIPGWNVLLKNMVIDYQTKKFYGQVLRYNGVPTDVLWIVQ